jgi:hypothetical protein
MDTKWILHCDISIQDPVPRHICSFPARQTVEGQGRAKSCFLHEKTSHGGQLWLSEWNTIQHALCVRPTKRTPDISYPSCNSTNQVLQHVWSWIHFARSPTSSPICLVLVSFCTVTNLKSA